MKQLKYQKSLKLDPFKKKKEIKKTDPYCKLGLPPKRQGFLIPIKVIAI
jgi:hypothetical protein